MTETIDALPWTEDDGGRAAAGFGSTAGDCVVRATCIALGQDYEATFTELAALAKKSPHGGVRPSVYGPYLEARGWQFHYVGRKTLTAEKLPSLPRIIVSLSGHVAAVVDGVVRDTYSSSGKGYRKFYGYYAPTPKAASEDPKLARQRITRKVRALLAKTIENGASEAESATALTLANKLMAEYALTFADINDVREEVYVEAKAPIGKSTARLSRSWHPVRACMNAIGDFAVCEHWYRGLDVVFFGTKADTELAIQLVALYRMQFDRDLADFQRSPEARSSWEAPAARRANYAAAWTGARSRRMNKLTAERKAPPKAAPRYQEGEALPAPEAEQVKSRELVVARDLVLKEKYASHTKDWAWGRARPSTRRLASTSAATAAAARSAEARGDLGVGKKLR